MRNSIDLRPESFPPFGDIYAQPLANLDRKYSQESALANSNFVVLAFPAIVFGPEKRERETRTRRSGCIFQVNIINLETILNGLGIVHCFPMIR